MPCQDDYPREDLRPKLDNLAQMLCALCDDLDATQRNSHIVRIPGLKGWWVEHKRRDGARIERERKMELNRGFARSGLDKLTHEEREALGL